MLTDSDKSFYAENGYLMVEDAVTPEQLARLREITRALIDASREVTESNEVYDLDHGHGPDTPYAILNYLFLIAKRPHLKFKLQRACGHHAYTLNPPIIRLTRRARRHPTL